MTKVIYYTTNNGDNPVKEFIAGFSVAQKNKIVRILTYIEMYGLITAIPHIKKLTGSPLWEIRILGQDNIRVLYAAIEKDVILVLHGFIKKSQKTPGKELETAINRLNNWLLRINGT